MPRMVFLLKRAYLATKKRLDEELAHYGLTSAQMDVLMTVWQAGGVVVQREMQHSLCVTAPTITGVIDNLVSEQLVERHISRDDARLKEIALTDAGRQMVERLITDEKQFSALFFADLSKKEITVLERTLYQIVSNMEEGEM